MRRVSGSVPSSPTISPAAPNARAVRAIAPRLSGSRSLGQPTIKAGPVAVARASNSSGETGGGRRPHANTPRWNLNPTKSAIADDDNTYTGVASPTCGAKVPSAASVARIESVVQGLRSNRNTSFSLRRRTDRRRGFRRGGRCASNPDSGRGAGRMDRRGELSAPFDSATESRERRSGATRRVPHVNTSVTSV